MQIGRRNEFRGTDVRNEFRGTDVRNEFRGTDVRNEFRGTDVRNEFRVTPSPAPEASHVIPLLKLTKHSPLSISKQLESPIN